MTAPRSSWSLFETKYREVDQPYSPFAHPIWYLLQGPHFKVSQPLLASREVSLVPYIGSAPRSVVQPQNSDGVPKAKPLLDRSGRLDHSLRIQPYLLRFGTWTAPTPCPTV